MGKEKTAKTEKSAEKSAETPVVKKSDKKYYKVLQCIAFGGGTYYGERNIGDKTIPADVVIMSEKDASAFGKDYLQEVKEKD
jgi:hypothetical protein